MVKKYSSYRSVIHTSITAIRAGETFKKSFGIVDTRFVLL